MFYPIVFSALSVAIVSSTVIELNTHEDGFLMMSYTVAGETVGASSLAVLIHSPVENLEGLEQPAGGLLNFTTVDNQHIITSNFLHSHPESRTSMILARFGSVFATEFARSYMMIPKNRQFVIDPANPRDFVYEGFLATTTSTNDEFLQVQVSVSIMNTTRSAAGEFVPLETMASTGTHDFALNTVVPEDSFPQSIIQILYDDLAQRGIPMDAYRDIESFLVGTFEIIGDLSDEVIDTFPIIQYRIHCDGGQDATIQLTGRDYIGPFDEGIRELLFRSGDGNSLGLNTLSHFALYVDNGNRTIGFGEPL